MDTQNAAQIDVAALFASHYKHFVRFAMRFVRSEQDAEDVVSQSFIEALRCKDSYSGRSKPSTWLFGIVWNVAHGVVRKQSAYSVESLNDEDAIELSTEYPDPAEVYELRQRVNAVTKFIDGLSAAHSATFSAVVFDEQTYEDAARKLCVTIGTVRSRMSRVRHNLIEAVN